MTHEPFLEWASLHAVGALDGEERRRFEAHLAAGCAACERELRELSAVTAALPLALPDAPLRPELRDRVTARIAAEGGHEPATTAQQPYVVRRPRASWAWAAGLVAAGLVVLFAWVGYDARVALDRRRADVARLEAENARLAGDLARERQEAERQRTLTALLLDPGTRVVALAGDGSTASAGGWMAWNPAARRGVLLVRDLPALPAGRQYQLWVIAGGKPVSAGVFDVGPGGRATLAVQANTGRADLFAITVEPAGGLPAPSGPIVMKGAA